MAGLADCPPLEVLSDFVADVLDADQRSSVSVHHDRCQTCAAILAELRADHDLAARLSHVFPSGKRADSRGRGAWPEVPGYAIEREIGRGGMGVVLEAVQRSSGRRVALKIVRGSHYVDEATRRLFEREIRALARLKHPRIAALYDAGRTESGDLWFAMERVTGQSLTAHAQSVSASRAARLALFARVCTAVHAAHQQGVVHRDLKPSNILVDEAGEPRVLDFGLAKVNDPDAEPGALVTQVGTVRGTLAYMSPEQARGDPDAIDSRTDVYALGVILYELLTGALPLDVPHAPIHEAVRVISEDAPVRPSARDRKLAGDLETIVLKALAKEPDQRYASAAALGEDVERFLSDDVILARPPSSLYQIRKLVRRHRLASALAALVFVVAVGSSVWLALLYRRSDRLRVDAEQATLREAEQRRLAQDRLGAAREEARRKELVVAFFQELVGLARHEKSGPNVRVVDLLKKAEILFDPRSKVAPGNTASLAMAVAGLHFSLGQPGEARRFLELALERKSIDDVPVDRDTAYLWQQMARVAASQGRWDECEDALAKCRDVVARLDLDDARISLGLRHVHTLYSRAHGDPAGAEADLREILVEQRAALGPEDGETLTTLIDLGIVLQDEGKLAEAEPFVREAVEIMSRVRGTQHPQTLNARTNLGMLLLDRGQHEEARALFESTLEAQRAELGPDHQQTLATQNNLAGAYLRLGQRERALEVWREVAPAQARALGENAVMTLNSLKNVGNVLLALGRGSEAVPVLEDLVARCDAALPRGHYLGIVSRTTLGRAYVAVERFAEAEAALVASHDGLRAMRGANPAWIRAAAAALVELYERWGKPADAEPYREAARPPAKAGAGR